MGNFSKLSIITISETFVDFVFFDVEIVVVWNDKIVFIPFFSRLQAFYQALAFRIIRE